MKGIKISVLGDCGPFSEYGRSISYLIEYRKTAYLLDCGAPIFEELKIDGVKKIRGLIATHSHEDHKRWFTDIALFKHYMTKKRSKLKLITSETIHEEFLKNSRGALERTLSPDAKSVIEIPYEDFVDPIIIGPQSKYKISLIPLKEDKFTWRVVDENRKIVPPEKAKVVINHIYKANRPRMLFKDEKENIWVEPELYYAFSENVFYNDEQNDYVDPDSGLKIRAIKSPVWHGPPTIGVQFLTENENVIFSSDTVFDPELWKTLATEIRQPKLPLPEEIFQSTYVIYGNINDLNQKTWGLKRYNEAINFYLNSVLFHDVSFKNSIVHTEYPNVGKLQCKALVLTHAPDVFVSAYPIAIRGKCFRVIGNDLFEEVQGVLYRLDADYYGRDQSGAFVAFKSDTGKYSIVNNNGYLELKNSPSKKGVRVNLFKDIHGEYYPILEDENCKYVKHEDGTVELVKYTKRGSKGKTVKNMRKQTSITMKDDTKTIFKYGSDLTRFYPGSLTSKKK